MQLDGERFSFPYHLIRDEMRTSAIQQKEKSRRAVCVNKENIFQGYQCVLGSVYKKLFF